SSKRDWSSDVCSSDLLPEGLINVVNGFGAEAGQALATHEDINKVAFTGETTTGRIIMQNASQNLIPVTLELGGKSPNIFFKDIKIGRASCRETEKIKV